jgi:superoxide reductase
MADLGSLIYTYDMAAGEALGKRESHTPKIVIPKKIKANEPFEISVSVGPHPNTLEHSIRWIEVYFYEDGRAFNPQMLSRIEFAPGFAEPEASIQVKLPKKGVIHSLEYCSLHGLWSHKLEIKVE